MLRAAPVSWRRLGLVLGLFLVVGSGLFSQSTGWISGQELSRPHVILINVDDLDVDLFEAGMAAGVFPNLDLLAREGVSFTNCHVTSPLCGPSRASLLTGRYLFEHGVKVHDRHLAVGNGYPGGYRHYIDMRPSDQIGVLKPNWSQWELSVWLRQAGYRTMMVGKYLHEGFTPNFGETWEDLRPPGWDDFYASLGGRYFGVNRYLSRRNGVYLEQLQNTQQLDLAAYPPRYRPFLQSRYRTNVEVIDAIQLIADQQAEQPDRPFFLYLAPFAPHSPGSGEMLDSHYVNWWPGMRQPRRADFDLINVIGKPGAVHRLPRLSAPRLAQSDAEYRRRTLAMKSLDDMLGLLWQSLQESGLWDQTMIIFTSDNGYMLGQQRHFGKQLPYDRCTKVPLIVWGPNWGVASDVRRSHLLSHVDVLPSLLEICQGPAVLADGVSFVELLGSGPVVSPPLWRPEGVLTEHYQRIGHAHQRIEGVYASVRMHDQRFTRWADGVQEYYDLVVDPLELVNRQSDLSTGERHLMDLLLSNFRRTSAPFGGSIAFPRFDGEQVFRRAPLEGYAEASGGVAEVRLVISRSVPQGPNGSGGTAIEYFDGQTWQPQHRQVVAQLQAPHTPLTRWEYDFFPNDQGEYRVDLTTRVYDRDGQYQTQVFRRWLMMENESPGTAITAPMVADSQISRMTDLNLAGWAKGHLAIREVRVVIRDRDTGQYFDGNGWFGGHRYVVADGHSPVDDTYQLWSYQMPAAGQARRLVVTARAFQVDGSYDTTVPVVRIDLK